MTDRKPTRLLLCAAAFAVVLAVAAATVQSGGESIDGVVQQQTTTAKYGTGVIVPLVALIAVPLLLALLLRRNPVGPARHALTAVMGAGVALSLLMLPTFGLFLAPWAGMIVGAWSDARDAAAARGARPGLAPAARPFDPNAPEAV